MADTALVNAIAQRDKLIADIRAGEERLVWLRQELTKATTFIEWWTWFAEIPGETIEQRTAGRIGANASQAQPSNEMPLKTKRASGNPKKEFVADAVRMIIQDLGVPISRSDLFQALKQRGILIQGADPEMVMSTMLWRTRNKVVRLHTGGYWLAEVPYLPAEYVPGEPRKVDAEELRMALAHPGRVDEDEISDLREKIATADEAYHRNDAPTVSDAEYEGWRQRLRELES